MIFSTKTNPINVTASAGTDGSATTVPGKLAEPLALTKKNKPFWIARKLEDKKVGTDTMCTLQQYRVDMVCLSQT